MPFCFFGNKKRSVTTSFGCWWSIRARGETNNSPVGCYRRVGQQRLPGARGLQSPVRTPWGESP